MNLLKTKLWIAVRLLFNKTFFFGGSAPLSMLGLVLGVAALIASQAVMRGFEDSLKKAMIDVTADIQVVKRGRLIDNWQEFSEDLKKKNPEIRTLAKFAYAEAVLASRGQVSGVLLQGMESGDVTQVLNLKNRLVSGSFPKDSHEVAIGIGLAKKFSLKPQDSIYLAVPLSTPFESGGLRRQAAEFKVVGVIDLGKNEWNERLVLSNLADLQKLIEIGGRYTGTFIKLDNADEAKKISDRITGQLGMQYNVMNWYDVNRNLFEAVAFEKIVIFFVVFLIVIVAAFNISSTLYVLIRQRYKDIAILKAVGLSSRSVKSLFLSQGFLIATVGSLLGLVVGLILCYGFMFLQTQFSLISGSVYKIDRIDVSVNFFDFLIIYLSTLAVCCLAAYFPARNGSGLQIVEGLREH